MYKKIRMYVTKTPDRRLWLASIGFVAVWRILLEVVNHFVAHITKIVPFYPAYLSKLYPNVVAPPFRLGDWAHWDGFHFLGVILNGYHPAGLEGQPSEVAFFPGFPLLIRTIFKVVPVDPILIGLVINLALSVVICATLYKLALVICVRYVPKGKVDLGLTAKLTVLFFFAFPASFFLAAFYADAIVVAATIMALYWTFKERYILATVSAGIVMLTKTTALVLIPVMLLILLENEHILHWNQWRKACTWPVFRRAVCVVAGPAAALGTYMAYLWKYFGDPLLFNKVETLWSRQNTPAFLAVLYRHYYHYLFSMQRWESVYGYLAALFLMSLPFLTIGIAWWFAKKFRAYWVVVLTVLTMFLPLFSGIMESLNRYALIVVPLPLALAVVVQYYKVNRYALAAFVLISVGFLCYFAGGFLIGGYFAG